MRRLELMWIIATREFKEQTRSRVFRISTAITILIVVAAVVFPSLADREQDKAVYVVGVVEPVSAQVIEAIQQTGPALDAHIRVASYPDTQSGEADLQTDAIVLLVVPGKELVSHVTPNPNVVTSVSRLTAALGETLRLYAGLDQAGLDASAATQALTHEPFRYAA